MAPFLAGAVSTSGSLDSIPDARSDGIHVNLIGDVASGAGGTYGTWKADGTFTYDSGVQKVIANGNLDISLSGTLTDVGHDLNLERLSSNYLHDVPLQSGGIGDTGDMWQAIATYGAPSPHPLVWIPYEQPSHYPTDDSTSLALDVIGQINTVDTLAQGRGFQIVIANKPTIFLKFFSENTPLNAGFSWASDQGQDFAADNVGINHLVLKQNSTATNMSFNFLMEARVEPDPILLSLYNAYFLRAPDDQGCRNWQAQLMSGTMTLAQISEAFYAHPYAQTTLGYASMPDAAFVQAIYANVLAGTEQDAPSSEEVKYWEAWLAQPDHTRAGMVLQFVTDALTYPVDTIADLTARTQAQHRQDTLENKVITAQNWLTLLGADTNISNFDLLASDSAFLASQKILNCITYDASTVTNARTFLIAAVTNGDPIDAVNRGSSQEICGQHKSDQTISPIGFTPTTLVVSGTTTASATATSGLPVHFTSTTPSICAIDGTNGSTVTGIATGTCIVAANQMGNASYNPAPQVSGSVSVLTSNSISSGEWIASPAFGSLTFVVTPDSTGISGVSFNFNHWTCGIKTLSGGVSITHSQPEPISGNHFSFQTSIGIPPNQDNWTINGTFSTSHNASGTWDAMVGGVPCSGDWTAVPSSSKAG